MIAPHDAATDGEDQACVTEILAGNRDAYARLVSKHKSRILGYASRFTRDRAELDDLAQEIFVVAYGALGSYRGDAPFSHWLMKIAVRKCTDWLRTLQRERRTFSSQETPQEIAAPEGREPWAAEDARSLLQWAFSVLDPLEKTIMTLSGIELMPLEQVAKLTDLSLANVKIKAFRARKKLAQKLETIREQLT